MSRRLLVVAPEFHGYGEAIGRSFSRRGYDVVVHAYDSGSKWEKAWNKARYELPAKLVGNGHHLSTEVVTRRAVDRIRQVKPDAVLTVRGDVLGDAYWESLDSARCQSVVWLYDELRAMTCDIDHVASVATIATYSSADAVALTQHGVRAAHVPLAYDADTPSSGRWPDGAVTFVGARHPARQALLEHLLSHGIPVKAYGRDWSSHPVDQIRTWRWTTPPVPGGRDVTRADAYGIMRESLATLNIHGQQSGFTMRTFESCGVGAVQIVDRDDVDEFYEPGVEVLVQHSADEAVDLCRRVVVDRTRMAKMRAAALARTLAEHTMDHRVAVLDRLW
ncbi:glycosyltransferase family protein [Acidipropionibacterium timonense]|uniref:glycosyltransferase family protein n=1 Tax=Acidipropionibacterium timonense TaxID=2161818 RepID=UPI001031287C|nr:glycosyltransferase [Acidipropionibacterium timonense]